MDGEIDLNEEFKKKKDVKLILIGHLDKLHEEHKKAFKALAKLKVLKIEFEFDKLEVYNNKLEACHVMLRKQSTRLKKIDEFIRARMRMEPRPRD